jgi:hypothetical protein
MDAVSTCSTVGHHGGPDKVVEEDVMGDAEWRGDMVDAGPSCVGADDEAESSPGVVASGGSAPDPASDNYSESSAGFVMVGVDISGM